MSGFIRVKSQTFTAFFHVAFSRVTITANEWGLLQGWNSLLVRPEPLLIKDIKVQVNKQKPNNVDPAQMKHNSDKMTIAPMSCQPCSKPNVVGSFTSFWSVNFWFSIKCNPNVYTPFLNICRWEM